MKELDLIEKVELREQYISRVEVLEKVKHLLVLPDIEMATTQQVADFYGVSMESMWKQVERNKDEVISDGYSVWKASDFKTDKMSELNITTYRGAFEVEFSNGQTERFSPRGVGLFPRRAILRVGMLLRDSEVAKEVRTQLLNIEETATVEHKTSAITEEQQLMLDVVCATNDGERLLAFSKYNDYKNRHIKTIENKNKVLTEGNLTWKPRESVNRMVRKIATKTFNKRYDKAWDKVYAEMLYKHNIGVNARKAGSQLKKPTVFDVLNEEEVKLLAKSCLSLCERYRINTDDIFIEF